MKRAAMFPRFFFGIACLPALAALLPGCAALVPAGRGPDAPAVFSVAPGPWPDLPDPEFRFHTFFVVREGNGSPEMFEYLRAARPEVVQAGYYGPLFHGFAYHPRSARVLINLPVTGERAALARQAEINREIRALGLKVVGHFHVGHVLGDWGEEPYGFARWYNEMWDEDLLGPKPVADVRELLQRDGSGRVLRRERPLDYLGLCVSSPHARDLLKRMVTIAVEAGVDGLITNFNYRWGCLCRWCQDEFRAYLGERYEAGALAELFGISDLEKHVFERIPAYIPSYPDPETAEELDWAAMDWGARHFKQVFDEVFIAHGRSLKPDLVIGTWNHLRTFMGPDLVVRYWDHPGVVGHSEERMFTPAADWHRGENYFWYSGSHGPADLAAGNAGDAWLNLLWLREMAEGKPSIIGKYESVRIRAGLAEAAALGAGGTGLAHRFQDGHGRLVMARHHNFVHAHRALYRESGPASEVGLLLPRQSVLARRPEAYDIFRAAGQSLAGGRVLFDVVLDQRLERERLSRYRALVLAGAFSLSDESRAMIEDYASAGGMVLVVGGAGLTGEAGRPSRAPGLFGFSGPGPARARRVGAGRVAWLARDEADRAAGALRRLAGDRLSAVDAPWTVRAALSGRPGGLALHLVNYDRDESGARERGLGGPAAELPVAAGNIPVALNLPPGARVASVTLLSPDAEGPLPLEHDRRRGRLRFTVPSVEVYGVVDIRFAPPGAAGE